MLFFKKSKKVDIDGLFLIKNSFTDDYGGLNPLLTSINNYFNKKNIIIKIITIIPPYLGTSYSVYICELYVGRKFKQCGGLNYYEISALIHYIELANIDIKEICISWEGSPFCYGQIVYRWKRGCSG